MSYKRRADKPDAPTQRIVDELRALSEHRTTKDQLPPLKISRRVKHGCCYRYARGPRRGRMCGEEVAKGLRASDFCPEHAIKILEKGRDQ